MQFLAAKGALFALLLVLAAIGVVQLSLQHWQPANSSGPASFAEDVTLILLGFAILAYAALHWRRRRAARGVTLTLR